jgi:hypothetical protein
MHVGYILVNLYLNDDISDQQCASRLAQVVAPWCY